MLTTVLSFITGRNFPKRTSSLGSKPYKMMPGRAMQGTETALLGQSGWSMTPAELSQWTSGGSCPAAFKAR